MSSRKTVVVPLTPDEAAALAEHELTISQGLRAFVAVGHALIAIRDGKLYRAEYKNFEEYCNKKWEFGGARRARQVIAATRIAEEIGTNGSGVVIENERQARALAAVPPHLREEVIQRARDESEQMTEQVVTRIVCRLLDERRAAAAEQRSASKPEEEDEEEDEDSTSEKREETSESDDSEGDFSTSEPTASSTLRRAAKKAEKPRLYLPRGLEHLRLAVKDFRHVDESDLETADARAALREGLSAADEAFSRVRLMAAFVEDA